MDVLQKMKNEAELLIAVDSNTTPLFPVEKFTAHRGAGQLHRAVTVFLFNEQGQTLVTQRSAKKPLWPLWWDAACSTHQWWPDESAVSAAKRRLPFEIGILPEKVIDWQEQFSYEYHAVYSPEWSENEINSIVTGTHAGEYQLNADEVASARWISPETLSAELEQPDHQFAPWFPLAWGQLLPKI